MWDLIKAWFIKWFGVTTVHAASIVLQPSEYDISYFDGKKSSLTHNAGFTSYKRWKRNGSEHWKDIALHFKNKNDIVGKKVLELACAKGFIVQDLREMGVDAYGLDASQYAYDEADPTVQPFLTVGDVRTSLSQYGRSEFDFVFSVRLFECVDDADIAPLISEINRISKKQAHAITTGSHLNAQYYNFKTLDKWLTYDWPKNTILAEYNHLDNFLTK